MLKLGDNVINTEYVIAITKKSNPTDVAHPKVMVFMHGGIAFESPHTFDQTCNMILTDQLDFMYKKSMVMNQSTKDFVKQEHERG